MKVAPLGDMPPRWEARRVLRVRLGRKIQVSARQAVPIAVWENINLIREALRVLIAPRVLTWMLREQLLVYRAAQEHMLLHQTHRVVRPVGSVPIRLVTAQKTAYRVRRELILSSLGRHHARRALKVGSLL